MIAHLYRSRRPPLFKSILTKYFSLMFPHLHSSFSSRLLFLIRLSQSEREPHMFIGLFFIMLSETDDHIYSNQSANEIINLMFPQLHLNFRSSLLFLIRLSQSESKPQMFLGFCFPQIAQYFNL